MVASGKAAATGQRATTQSKPCKGDRYSARPYRTPTNFNSVPVAALLSELATGYHLSPLARLVELFCVT